MELPISSQTSLLCKLDLYIYLPISFVSYLQKVKCCFPCILKADCEKFSFEVNQEHLTHFGHSKGSDIQSIKMSDDHGNLTADELALVKRTIIMEGLPVMSLYNLKYKMSQELTKEGDEIKAFIYRRHGCEITFGKESTAEHFVKSGFVYEFTKYNVLPALNDLTVTLSEVPIYVQDWCLISKLKELGCHSVGTMQRTEVEGVETGERKVSVRFGSNLKSLPSTIMVRFNERYEPIRVKHRNQVDL